MLATIYLFATLGENFSIIFGDELSESHWTSYFHQASIGDHISYKVFSNWRKRNKIVTRPYAYCVLDALCRFYTYEVCFGIVEYFCV